MASNQPLTFRVTGELTAKVPAPVVPTPVSPTLTPPFSLLLVGLKQHDSTEVTFCALDISKFGSGELDDALKELICSTICCDMYPGAVDINRKVMHWASTAIIFGAVMKTDLVFLENVGAEDPMYDILRLAAGRGMGDVLMVDYAIV